MQRIDNQEPEHRRMAFKILAWVSYAFRRLSLKELQHALAVEPRDTELDEELVLDGQSITSLCAGLVIVDQRTNIVNLVHYSTKNYFDEIRHIRFPNFHATITLVCATYLTLDTLKGAKIWEMVQNFPLACYAAQYLGDHARYSPEEALEPSILDIICDLLSHPDKRKPLLSLLDGLDLIRSGFYSAGKSLQNDNEERDYQSLEIEMPTFFGTALELSDHYQSNSSSAESADTITSSDTITQVGDEEVWETKIKSSRIPEVTALHLAASMGLAKIASLLLKETTNIDAVDETGKTALTLALERGFEKAVELLVNSGACVDLRLDHGRGIFLLVTERNWHSAAESIAEKARITATQETSAHEQDQVRFLLAVYFGHIDESKQLLREGRLELVSRDRGIGKMALFLATEREDTPVIQLILTFGLDINSKDDFGQTALHRATRRKSEPLMRFLLSNGAEVDCKDDNGRTPWSASIRCGNTDILGILREAGANPNTFGLQGASELYTAAKDGETEIVKLMLESGTNPSIQTKYFWAPLHWAACYGHNECTRLLIEAGADVSVVSDQNVTPLDLAIQQHQTTAVQMLSAAGAKQFQDLKSPTSTSALKETEEGGEWVSVHRTLQPEESGGTTKITPKQEEKIMPDQEKLRLAYDKPLARTLVHNTAVGQFVFPSGTSGRIENIYEISHVLEANTSCISTRCSATRAEMWDYPLPTGHFNREDMLYDIIRVQPDYQEFEIRPQHPKSLPGSIQMHRDWTGGWKVRHLHEDATKSYLLRTTPDWSKKKDDDCRWMTETGALLARSGWEDATPNLCFEHSLGATMQDLLVTCWIAKLWSESVALVQ